MLGEGGHTQGFIPMYFTLLLNRQPGNLSVPLHLSHHPGDLISISTVLLFQGRVGVVVFV